MGKQCGGCAADCGGIDYRTKTKAVLRLWRGERVDALARELGTAEAAIVGWSVDFAVALQVGTEPYVLTIDEQRGRILRDAVQRFHITPREVQVLTLALDGNGAAEIAGALRLSTSTVVGHMMRLRIKTRTHSSIGMIAKVLGWEDEPPRRDQERACVTISRMRG
jgi:DNA-binding CsgD family transcriptional regulator